MLAYSGWLGVYEVEMSLLIKNGQITTATDQYVADILCEGETISAIGRSLTAPAGAEVAARYARSNHE